MIPDYSPVYYWVQERERIRVNKEALRLPHAQWSRDPIFYEARFCNVRREDDRVTRWIADNIRRKHFGARYLWLMCCIQRLINWPDTLAELMTRNAWPLDDDWQPSRMTTVLNQRIGRGEKVYTGAYMIPAPHEKGADKQQWICEQVIGDLWNRRAEFQANEYGVTLETVHGQVMKTKGFGFFLAYQAVVDMRFTFLLCDAPDVSTWAAAGPGTIRGLNRIYGRDLDGKLSQDQARDEMRRLFAGITEATGVRMDFSDIPNVLCETDKYLRLKLGQGKTRARYVPGRGY